MWQKILIATLWAAAAVIISLLLIAAMAKKESLPCAGVNIEIKAANDMVFLNKQKVMEALKANNAAKGTATAKIDLGKTETELEKNPWVKNAELYFDNKQELHVLIDERTPVARVFTLSGRSFYIDSSCKKLPLSDELSARVPVFTSFPSDKIKLSKPDSALLADVKTVAMYIMGDSFLSAQVAQVDITSNGRFEILPVAGNQLIRIGDAEDLDEKFTKLLAFYQQVWSKSAADKYAVIDVQYKNQVVAVKGNGTVNLSDSSFAIQPAPAINITQQDSAAAASKQAVANSKNLKVKSNNTVRNKDVKQNKNQQAKAVMKKVN